MERRTVLISGCGPAGVAAAVVFAKRGFRVQVFEKRESPAAISSSNEDRAFVVGINARGRRALLEAGFDLEALAFPGSGIVAVDRFLVSTPSRLPWNRSRASAPRVPQHLGDRMSWVRQLVQQAEGMGLGIEFLWESRLLGVDLQRRLATIQHRDGAPETLAYDLLLGADGANSAVRGELEAAVPGMRCSVEPSNMRYKVFRGVALPESGGGQKMPPAIFFGSSLRTCDPQSTTIIAVPFSNDGKACGLVNMHAAGWEGLETPADYVALLRKNSPRIPDSWLGPVCEQLATRKLNVSGYCVRTSQFHGPSVVLIGDAAHGVTPVTGSGMNSALEDAWLLGQLLDGGVGLAALPRAFTEARLKDARALLWLDGIISDKFGRNGYWRWRYQVTRVENAARRALRALLGPARVGTSALAKLSETCLPFSQIKAAVMVEDAFTALALAGGLALTLWALVARVLAAAPWGLGSHENRLAERETSYI